MIKVGTCGWNRHPLKGDHLINYAQEFDVVEVNSTFYRLPRVSTAERWLDKARSVNPGFEFTMKMPREITHVKRFRDVESEYYRALEVAEAMESRVLLFQSPASFKPTPENIAQVRDFFSSVDRGKFLFVWEVRWAKNWTQDIVRPLFCELKLVHAVDPLRQKPFTQGLKYFRLHGFGKPMMYKYTFSGDELNRLVHESRGKGYIFFNNFSMYEDARRFKYLLEINLG